MKKFWQKHFTKQTEPRHSLPSRAEKRRLDAMLQKQAERRRELLAEIQGKQSREIS